MKNFSSLLRTLVAAATLAQCSMLSAQEVRYAESPRIAVYLPDGFCELGSSAHEMERKRFVQESLGSARELLSLLAPCNEVVKLAAGKTIAFQRWVIVELPKVNETYYSALSSETFVQQAMAQAAEDPADVLTRLEKRLKRQMRDQIAIDPIHSGVISSDLATYQGSIASVKTLDGKIGTIIGVEAMTAAKGIVVRCSMFELADAMSSFEMLLKKQRGLMAKFLAINE